MLICLLIKASQSSWQFCLILDTAISTVVVFLGVWELEEEEVEEVWIVCCSKEEPGTHSRSRLGCSCYNKLSKLLQLLLLQPPKLQEKQLSRWPCPRSGRTTTRTARPGSTSRTRSRSPTT